MLKQIKKFKKPNVNGLINLIQLYVNGILAKLINVKCLDQI